MENIDETEDESQEDSIAYSIEFKDDTVAFKDTPQTEDDPFAYLERGAFTSEKFKIEVRGLPKFYGMNEFKKLLNNKLKLKSSKIKPPKRRSDWIYVCFRSEEDRQLAITTLNGYKWKNKTLSAQIASAVPDPLVQKRCENKANTIKNLDSTQSLSNEELLKLNTVPLWNIPYEEQLRLKMEKMKYTLVELSKELLRYNKANTKVRELLEERCQRYDGMPCKLSEIRHVPSESDIIGYRNKCEFTIGINEENGLKTVGFRFGSYVQGTTNVGCVDDLPHVSDIMKNVVKRFENFIRKTDLDVYNPEDHCGFWKQLTVRVGMQTNQLMVIVGTNISGIPLEQLQIIKSEIIYFFVHGDGKACGVTSLYLQIADLKTNRKLFRDSLELLHGSATIIEELCGLKFYISPLSFFQTNTAATEILYSAVEEITSLSPEVTVLDICCGTGSIGLSLAKSGAQILGIESEAAAIENARINCKENNIENCSFFHGRAEDILSSVISKATNENIVAIVDPPRAGLHQKALVQLRRANIKKIVYLSCNPKAALPNFINLGKPPSKTLFGSQFLPVIAIPVDNFPFTNHCELIVYFERYDISNSDSTEDLSA